MACKSRNAIAAAAAAIVLSGCAFGGFMTPGVTLSAARGVGVQLSQCSPFGTASPIAAQFGVRSPVIQARATQNRIRRIQSPLSVGFSPLATMENAKRIASGEC